MRNNEGNRKLIIRIIAVALAVFMVIGIIFSSIHAGAFDANDYDSSDSWDSYSYDYDSDYDDYDYSSDYDSSYLYDDDDDDYYAGGSTYYSNNSGSGGSSNSSSGSGSNSFMDDVRSFFFILPVFIIVIVVICVIGTTVHNNKTKDEARRKARLERMRENRRNTYQQQSTYRQSSIKHANNAVNLPNRNIEIEQIVRNNGDPRFSYTYFLNFAQHTWTDVQMAWCARDLEPVRRYMGTNLYNTTNRQVQSKIDQHVTYHYEDISFLESYLTAYAKDREFEYVTAFILAKYIDYQTDDDTGNIVKGDTMQRWVLAYKMKFQRALSSVDDVAKTCPNCGAPLNIAASAKCIYCGTTITAVSKEWVLSDFTTVRADTTDEGIRN